jgi:alpha-glucosidase
MVDFYRRVAKKAAEHHLLLDFHGAYKPTGIRRTYPNLITREGVLGLEYCKWSDRATPEHDCIIPFTRMLAGPLDYTPGGFSNTARGEFKSQNLGPMTQGTRCHQLGLYVVFESPLQMLVDFPENYRDADGIVFLRHVPASWDETKVLNGSVGDYVTIARRSGEEWYIGAITDWDARELSVSLDFLDSGDYRAEIFADGSNAAIDAESVAISEETVNAQSTLTLPLAPGGGYAARLVPVR